MKPIMNYCSPRKVFNHIFDTFKIFFLYYPSLKVEPVILQDDLVVDLRLSIAKVRFFIEHPILCDFLPGFSQVSNIQYIVVAVIGVGYSQIYVE